MATGNKATLQAQRLSWEMHHQRIAPPSLFACHYCHNRGCVNPLHIHIGTQKENMADSKRDGRMPQGAAHFTHVFPGLVKRGEQVIHHKLTASDVVLMRQLSASGMTYKALGKHFNVSPQTAWDAVKRRTWNHL